VNDDFSDYFLKSLGFPTLRVHTSFNHFDFQRERRRILVIGPMGSGKTEFSARVWRDSRVALSKSDRVAEITSTGEADRRNVFFVRFRLDESRFTDYPADALAYRGGYERCGENIAHIDNSFELETLVAGRPDVGTWILDEASFYDERIAYVVRELSERFGCVFIFPTLILNFRRDIFNPTARLLLENSTDVFPLTAYCEHEDCIDDSIYTYRYYRIDGDECPALYFDPLIVIGGDTIKDDPREPNYCTRCDDHHYLPGKEYTYLTLKPLGESASRGDLAPLKAELGALKDDVPGSRLAADLRSRYVENGTPQPVNMNALKVHDLAERALIYLYAEQNLVSEVQIRELTAELGLDKAYLERTLADNRRPVAL
jgi:thymidine kinase